MKDSDRIIAEFESELKAGKNPSVKEYNRRYKGLDDKTLGALITLQALYDYKDAMKLPAGFAEEQNKLVQQLIKKHRNRPQKK